MLYPFPVSRNASLLSTLLFVSLLLLGTPLAAHADDPEPSVPDNFKRENLIAWCIVPFDAKQRGPEQRARMLSELGLKRCAYDWRPKHVPEFEAEIEACDRHGIEYVAFWGQHEKAYQLFQERKMRPDIWIMLGSPKAETQQAKIKQAVDRLMPLIEKTSEMGCRLGLYNHGGWSGEPENLIAICEAVRNAGFSHVGIVYNFHHAHHRIHQFDADLKAMRPWLHCLNLNGMVDLAQFPSPSEKKRKKIRPIGQGDHEATMIEDILRSGYDGPIGILGHVSERDVEVVLRENLEGLENLLGQRSKPARAKTTPPVR